MTDDKIKEKIEELVHQRELIVIEANRTIAFLSGKIEALTEMLQQKPEKSPPQ